MAEKRHESLTPESAQRLAYLQQSTPDAPEAKVLSARLHADKTFRRLMEAEKTAAAAPAQQGDPRQIAADAQRIGLTNNQAGYRRDPAVVEGSQRISALREHRDAAIALDQARLEYEGACSRAADAAVNLAEDNLRIAIAEAERELMVATRDWRDHPTRDREHQMKKLQGELERLVKIKNQP